MGRPRIKPVDDVMQRLMRAAEARSIDGVAAWLGANVNTARNWAKRGNVPDRWLHTAAGKSGKPFAWFAHGEPDGEVRPIPGSPPVALATGERLSAALVEESTVVWNADPTSGRSGARSGGGTGSIHSALLPADASNSLLLTLSLEVGGDGRRKDYSVIPALIGSAHAGRGDNSNSPLKFDRAGDVVLSHEWLAKNLQHTSGNLTTVQVNGDSMAPTLLDGDTIIIDRGVSEIDVDGIYVIDRAGSRLVKRVQRKFDDSLVVISDNAAYEKETIPRGKAGEFAVIGRMVWPRVR